MADAHKVNGAVAAGEDMPSSADLVATIEALRGTRVLMFAPNEKGEGISNSSYDKVWIAVQGLPRATKLDVIIHSLGGYPGSAYKIARLLQEFDDGAGFTAIIPRRAKSAATLLSLGAKQILMAEGAELGPIDTQIPHPHEPEERISALEGMKGLEAVSGFCHRFLDETMMLVLGQTGRGIKDSLKLATEFAAPVVRPLFEQIDPMDLGRYKRALEIGQEYAKRLLQSAGGYTHDHERDIPEKLANGYPQHEFVIDVREAASIGLRAEKIETSIGMLARMAVAGLPTGHHVGFLETGDPIATLIPVEPTSKPADATPAAVHGPSDGGSNGVQVHPEAQM
ncbi:SDH family Clp fold serine proteinase [Anaeromyxobacter oryzisoli]|uniref:SDH family Clp fold serine proteinase n=1 Tax=Anaeromyxobacter oryzisoli TaxID=2925408 RepID=UPI001F57F128|nr:hypothetical protein [Anaeromyxobacter sp. SG63]